MRKWLLITTALVGVTIAEPAAAGPVTWALVQQGVGFFSAFTAANGAIAGAALRIGAGLLLSAGLSRAQMARQKSPSMKREFTLPTSLPAKRAVYGHYRMMGTPVPWRVRGDVLYGCLLMNSRPSAGTNLTIWIDGRQCTIEPREDEEGTELPPEEQGTLDDFESPGALVRIDGFPDPGAQDWYCRAWLGLGDQTTCPDDIVAEAPEYFAATDAWQGCTVLWIAMNAGGSIEKRMKRWPAVPPVVELEMDWSLIWDMRDGAQDKDDPATWTYSDNQALCLLDALRTNPVRRYRDTQLILDSFEDGADVADEAVTRWHDSVLEEETVTEARYRAAGFVDWSQGELMDLIQPLADAGAGRIVRAGGKVGYAAGAWRASVHTFTDILDEGGVDFGVVKSSREVPAALKGIWVSPDRSYEEAELGPYAVPNGPARIDGDNVRDLRLPMCPSGTQCQRVVKIEALRLGAQKTLTCVLPPDAIEIMPGATVTSNLPAGWTRLNGTWRVDSANPGVWLADADKVAFRVPVTLSENTAAIYAWDPETDEQEIVNIDLTDSTYISGSPTDLTAETVEVNTGGAIVLMMEFSFIPPTIGVVETYEVIYRQDGETAFTPLPDIPGDTLGDDGRVTQRFGPVAFAQSYDIGVRSVGPNGYSAWVYALDVVAGLAIDSAAGTAGPGRMAVTGTAPDIGYFAGVRLYRAAVGDDFADADRVGEDIAVAPGAAFSVTFGDASATDLVTGGDFSDAGDWSTSGNWVVSGGEATKSPVGAGQVSQPTAMSTGEAYRFTADISSLTGAARFAITGSGDVSSDFGGNGTLFATIIATSGADGVAIEADSAGGLSADNFRVVRNTATCLDLGPGDFWAVPITETGSEGTPSALGTHHIP